MLPYIDGLRHTAEKDLLMSDVDPRHADVGLPELEGAATAPILVFDEVSVYGLMPGFGRLTLSAYIQDEGPNGTVRARRVVVAHLRANEAALASLRSSIDNIALMATGPSEPPGKAN